MLDARLIAAWTTHAPWALNYQVEQDLILTHCVEAIFRDRYLANQVAMRGGTVLHKVHLAPPGRYSEDIDLVAVGEATPGQIAQGLIRVLSPIFKARPVQSLTERIQLAVRNAVQPSVIRRLKWEYRPTSGTPARASVKVEVNVSERTPVFDVVRLPLQPSPGGSPVDVVSFSVAEMLGTKMRALRQRDKGRDLFDLAYAWSVCSQPGHPHPINPHEVATAFQAYMARENTTVTRQDFEDDLSAKLLRHAFRADMQDVLAPNVLYDIDQAAVTVRQVFLSQLP